MWSCLTELVEPRALLERPTMPTIPNMGIVPGMYRPTSVDHIYRDPDVPLEVTIAVYPVMGIDPKDNHWDISWTIMTLPNDISILRRLQVERAIISLPDGISEKAGHLTNWGPVTKSACNHLEEASVFPIAVLTLAQRLKLERIASATEVQEPDGRWNCQDWVVTVLESAVGESLFLREEVDSALRLARGVAPRKSGSA